MKLPQPAEISAAKIVLFTMEYFYDDVLHALSDEGAVQEISQERAEKIAEWKEKIAQTDSPAELVEYLRKADEAIVRDLICRKVLEHQEEAMPLLIRRFRTTGLDTFVEAAVQVFAHCEEQYFDEMLADYQNIRSPYAQSMFCVAIGFRNRTDCRQLLMQEYKKFSALADDESDLEQGPLLALHEL